jgi:hypothetical protein
LADLFVAITFRRYNQHIEKARSRRPSPFLWAHVRLN